MRPPSLTPGCFLLSDGDNSVGVTLPEMAAIVAEWDRAHTWPRDVRASEPALLLKGVTPTLRVHWYGYGAVPRLTLVRGETRVFVEGALVDEMRAVLEARLRRLHEKCGGWWEHEHFMTTAEWLARTPGEEA